MAYLIILLLCISCSHDDISPKILNSIKGKSSAKGYSVKIKNKEKRNSVVSVDFDLTITPQQDCLVDKNDVARMYEFKAPGVVNSLNCYPVKEFNSVDDRNVNQLGVCQSLSLYVHLEKISSDKDVLTDINKNWKRHLNSFSKMSGKNINLAKRCDKKKILSFSYDQYLDYLGLIYQEMLLEKTKFLNNFILIKKNKSFKFSGLRADLSNIGGNLNVILTYGTGN